MTDNDRTLTTAQFSQMSGITIATTTRMLRQGKLHGEKRNGKWAINPGELQHPAVVAQTGPKKSSADLGPIVDAPVTAGKSYHVETFAEMTYLTEHGVRRWLRTGRLSGSIDSNRKGLVDATNLDRPEFKHLIRQ